MKVKDNSFEKLMDELTAVMKQLENPETTLENQLLGYEKGMALCNELQAILKNAEDRITIINKEGQEEKFE